MIVSLAIAWWRVFTRPWTSSFQGTIGGKSHTKTLVGVVPGAVLCLGLSRLARQVAGPKQQAFMRLASIWVKSGTPAANRSAAMNTHDGESVTKRHNPDFKGLEEVRAGGGPGSSGAGSADPCPPGSRPDGGHAPQRLDKQAI